MGNACSNRPARLRRRIEPWAVHFLAALSTFACSSDEGERRASAGGAGGAGGMGSPDGSAGTVGTDGSVRPPIEMGCAGTSTPMTSGGGYEQCADGLIHRPAIGECSAEALLPDGGLPPIYSGPEFADACLSDDDCATGTVCFCERGIGRCVEARCRSDADCPGETLCTPYEWSCLDGSFNPHGLACQTPSDTCALLNSCGSGANCTVGPEGVRACGGEICGIGRPFLVAGEARLASVRPGSGWGSDEPFELPRTEPSSAARAEARDAWLQVARMEHASVAAFARFSLELLGLGAPAELVEASQGAMADEIRHARLAFGVARALGGAAVEPGPLDVGGALGSAGLEDVVEATVLEGCIGETLAALEAREAAERAEVPELRKLLAGIAEDESRHALLAWRFVAWAIDVGGAPVASRACAILEREIARILSTDDTGSSRPELEALGVLSDATRSAVRAAAARQVLGPALDRIMTGRQCVAQVISSVPCRRSSLSRS